jgi:tetratricopeptide (TPR) repeat protein
VIAMLQRLSASTLLLLLATVTIQGGELLDRANETYNSGNTYEAIELYRKAALAGENPALCYFNMANAWFQLDSLPQSIVYYKACIGAAPAFFRGHLNLAVAYYTLEDLGACIASARRALDLEPSNQKGLMILAASYRKAGSYPEAIATFEQLVASYPENDEPYIALAELYRELEDMEQTIEWLQRYPIDGQNRAYAFVMLGDILEAREEYERALYYLRQAWGLDSSNKWLFYRIVMLHQKMGNNLIALEQVQRALETMPEFAELALLGGNIAFEAGKISEAERLYAQARDHGSAGAVIGLENIRILRLNATESALEG